MKRRLIVLATAIVLGASLLVPAVAFAGGDQVHRPAPGEWLNEGADPLEWQLQINN
jgi:hypothetical protein